MRPLIDWHYDPRSPLQTRRGTRQALKCSEQKVKKLVALGVLDEKNVDGMPRITTVSIKKLTGETSPTEG